MIQSAEGMWRGNRANPLLCHRERLPFRAALLAEGGVGGVRMATSSAVHAADPVGKPSAAAVWRARPVAPMRVKAS